MAIRRAVPNLATDDLAAAVAFYVDVLGFEVVMDMGWIVALSDPANRTAQLSVMTHDATAPVIPDVAARVRRKSPASRERWRLPEVFPQPLDVSNWCSI